MLPNQPARLILLAVISIPALYFALPAIANPKAPLPAKALNGQWRAEMSPTQVVLLEFKNDALEFKVEVNGAEAVSWTAKVVLPKEHTTQHMDWTNIKAGEQVLPDNKCLYRLAGDTLLVIGGGPDKRPTHFYSGPGAEPRTLIFTRVVTEAR